MYVKFLKKLAKLFWKDVFLKQVSKINFLALRKVYAKLLRNLILVNKKKNLD